MHVLGANIPDSYLAPLIVALLTAIVGLLAWLVRTVTTLAADIRAHILLDNERFKGVHEDVKNLRSDIAELRRRVNGRGPWYGEPRHDERERTDRDT